MSFGGKKSKPKPDPKPTIVAQPGSGSGVTYNEAQTVSTIPDQSSLLKTQEDDELLKKGVG